MNSMVLKNSILVIIDCYIIFRETSLDTTSPSPLTFFLKRHQIIVTCHVDGYPLPRCMGAWMDE